MFFSKKKTFSQFVFQKQHLILWEKKNLNTETILLIDFYYFVYIKISECLHFVDGVPVLDAKLVEHDFVRLSWPLDVIVIDTESPLVVKQCFSINSLNLVSKTKKNTNKIKIFWQFICIKIKFFGQKQR